VSQTMMPGSARRNGDNLRRLEELRATYERLRTERIRAESEVERLTAELERMREQARAAFGADDEGEIARLVEAARARNDALVSEFAALIAALEARLQSLGGGR
jgi:phage shock protein A